MTRSQASKESAARHPGFPHETRDVFRAADADVDLTAGFASDREARPKLATNHLYLTEQPYGFVFAFETGLPAIDSSSATFT